MKKVYIYDYKEPVLGEFMSDHKKKKFLSKNKKDSPYIGELSFLTFFHSFIALMLKNTFFNLILFH